MYQHMRRTEKHSHTIRRAVSLNLAQVVSLVLMLHNDGAHAHAHAALERSREAACCAPANAPHRRAGQQD